MANKDTRILKSNTLEELRQKSNEISLHLGDNDQLNVNVADKTFNFVNVSAGTSLFHNTDDASKVIDFEIKPEESLDNTAGYIILKGSPSIPASFSIGSSVTQSGGYSATIEAISSEKILVKNSSGSFSSSQNLVVGSGTILAANVERQIGEAYPVGVVRVYKNNVEMQQNLLAGGFHVVNLAGRIELSNSPTVTDFTEGSTVYQGTNLGSATFSGVVLRATSTVLLLKSYTGSLNPSTQIKLDGSSSTITGANHGALINIINSFGNAIELNTDAAANDDIRIFGPTIVDAVNELQDDVGITENLNTTATNLVAAVNEIESVFDASANKIISSPDFTIDSESDIILDVKGGDVILKDSDIGGTNRFGGFMNLNNGLVISTGPAGTVGIVFDTNGNQIVGGNIALGDNKEIKIGTSDDLKLYHNASDSYIDELGTGSLIVRSNGLGIIHKVATGGTYYDAIQATAFGVTLHTQGTEKLRTNTTGIQVTGLTDTDTLLVSSSADIASAKIGDLTNNRIVIAGTSGELEDDANFTFDGTNFTIGSSKFVVAQATGNTLIVGTLDVDGATTLDGDLDLNGSVDVSTNAVIHGTLDVDGNTTLDGTTIDGDLDLNGSADISTNLTVGGILNIGTLSAQFTAAHRNNVKLALNELHQEVGNAVITGTGTAAAGQTNLTAAINMIDAEIGTVADYEGGIYGGTDISKVLVKLQTGVINNDTNITDLFADVGNLSLSAGLGSDLTSAVNSLSTQVGNNDSDISNLATTIDGTSTVPSSISLTGLSSTNIKAALNELAAEKLNLNTGGTTGAIGRINAGSDSVQDVISRLTLTGDITFKPGSDISGANSTNASTFTFNTGTVLDISNASLLLPGSASNVNIFSTSFLEVDGNVETPMGFSVDRAHVTQTNKSDVRLQWNENHTDGTSATRPARGWQLQGLNDSGNSNTADIVTFYNAKELITNNTESGISVDWDASNQNFDFNVNDPTIQLSGDVVGSAVMTNLGNVNISTVIQPNSVALGSDTTGNYIKTLAGTTYQVTVSPAAHTEGKDATLSIPTDFRMPGTAKVLSTTNSTSKTTGALTVAGGVGINDDLYVGGDLVVQGDTVTLNTETLTVEDTLVLAGNNLSSEPGSGGFGLEVGPITSPSGVAAGVTGAHSIVYNYGASGGGRWEADGSLILSEATLASPGIEVNGTDVGTLSGSKTLDLKAGTGIGLSSTVNGDDFEITINNTLDGYSGWFLSTQGSNRGNIADDERVDFHGGTDLTARYDTTNTNRVIFDHDNVFGGTTSTTFGQSGGEDGTYIKSLTVTPRGHITAVTTDDFDDRYDNYNHWKLYLNNSSVDNITSAERLGFDEGAGIDLSYDNNDITITHQDTSTVGNLNSDNSGNTFIQDLALTFDTFGHVTGATVGTGTVSVGNATITLQASAVDGVHGITMDADNSFTTNQSTNEIITIAHANTSSQASVNNSNNNVIQDVTLDTYGHVTGLVSKNITSVSGNAGSATTLLVTANNSLSNANLPLTYINAGGTANRSFYEDDQLTYNPATNTLNAGSFNGALDYGDITNPPTIGNGTVTIAGGTLLSTSGDNNFSMNQSNSQTLTINHDNVTRSDSANAQVQKGYDATFEIIDAEAANNGITTNAQGHVTGVKTKVIQMPSAQTLPSVGNGPIQGRTSGLGLSGSMDATANQSGTTTFTVTSNATTSSTGNTIVYRDASGDINVRLLRSEYDTTNSNIGFMMTQVNTGTNNYVRPSTAAQVRSFLNVADGAGVNTDRYVNSASFNTTNGVLTLTRAGSDTGTVTVDLDGRYLTSAPSIPNGFGTINFGGTNCAADSTSDTFTILAGTGISLAGNASSDSGTISVSSDQRGKISQFGSSTSDYVVVDTNSVDFYLDGARDMTLENDGDLHVRANITAYSTTITSDQKLKENVQVVNGALEKVSQLDGVTFDWKDGSGKSAGVIAQNVENVLPSAVSEVENLDKTDTHKVVDYNQLSALFIEAIKELKEENKQLRSEIEGLKSINS